MSHLASVVKWPNTTGCEPVSREFESHHSPQKPTH